MHQEKGCKQLILTEQERVDFEYIYNELSKFPNKFYALNLNNIYEDVVDESGNKTKILYDVEKPINKSLLYNILEKLKAIRLNQDLQKLKSNKLKTEMLNKVIKFVKVKLTFFYEQENLAKAILLVYFFKNGLGLEEVLFKIRGHLISRDDELRDKTIESEYRKINYNEPFNRIAIMSTKCDKIVEEMKQLDNYYSSIKWEDLSQEEIVRKTAEIACEFTTIHPYLDANGRTSRMLVDYILKSNNMVSPILFKGNDTRMKYLKAIRRCNYHAFKFFEDWFVEQYKQQIDLQ